MNTENLWRLAVSDPILSKEFGGVFACDLLPKKKEHYNAFISNLDCKNNPGSHWIAMYFRNEKCYYFCSYGVRPQNLYILKFMKRNSINIEFNEQTFQSPYSKSCGLFCLYFLMQISRDKKLIKLNPRNKLRNEVIVYNFVKNRLYYNIWISSLPISCGGQCSTSLLSPIKKRKKKTNQI